MKLVHPLLENQIVFEENKVNILIIENKTFMVEFLNELNQQVNGVVGRFVLAESGKELHIEKSIQIIIDYFNIDFNNRKIITGLYKNMEEIAMGEELYCETIEIGSRVHQYIYKLEEKIAYGINNDEEFNVIALLKALNVKFEIDDFSFMEKLVEYMKLLVDIANIKIVVFVNLKSYITDEDIKEIYKFLSYNKIRVLLIENTEAKKRFDNESIYVIDNDLCEIML